jgi:hypothetical protein
MVTKVGDSVQKMDAYRAGQSEILDEAKARMRELTSLGMNTLECRLSIGHDVGRLIGIVGQSL